MTPDTSATVVVLGGVFTEYRVWGQSLPAPGTPAQGTRFLEGPGGAGFNQSVAVARLGGRVSLVARVGSETRADEAVARLAMEGVGTRHIARDAAHPTGAGLTMSDALGHRLTMTEPGANGRVSGLDVQSAGRTIREARVLSCTFEVPPEAVLRAVRTATTAGARTVVDLSPPADTPEGLLPLVDVVVARGREAGSLADITVTDRTTAEVCAARLLELGAGAAAVSLPGGVLVHDHRESTWHERPLLQPIDEAAAHDAMVAGVVVALAEGAEIRQAVGFGLGAWRLAAGGSGTGAAMPSRETVERLLRGG